MDEVGITIIGAGVVGLAIAAELSKEHCDIVVLERHEAFGQEASSRNSEVVHSGIYYPPGSRKARLCVEGAGMLYRYCEAHNIPHAVIGKLIVAAEGHETGPLMALMENGLKNNAKGLRFIGKDEIRKMEPAVKAEAAIWSTRTGIVDSHSLMNHLYRAAISRGATFSFGTGVNRIERRKDGYLIGVEGEDYTFCSKVVVNAAGASSDRVAALAGIDVDQAGYRLRYCKGSYFSYAKKSPVGRLVYPLPHKDLAGLGVHATLDLGGRLRFGPDAEYVDSVDYRVDPARRDAFYEGASRIIDGLDKEAFLPDMAGIRPKIGDGVFRDFVIREESGRGLHGLVNLVGIESPGLTASLALAGYVRDIIGRVTA